MTEALSLFAVPGVPLIGEGDSIAEIILQQLQAADYLLAEGDVIVIAQKIISKAEGRYRRLGDINPGVEAIDLARQCDKDPRLVQAILDESESVVRVKPGVLIVKHKLGYIHANAGIDQSNIRNDEHRESILLLPENPDVSARAIAESIYESLGVRVGVIINDSFGRPWRMGTCGVCIGSAGVTRVVDQRGNSDLFGNELKVTQPAVADELAAAASFLMGQAAEGKPVVIVRGADVVSDNEGASLIRPSDQDLFL